MWATFAPKAHNQLYIKFLCKLFLDFPILAKPSQYVELIYKLAWLVGVRKSEEDLFKN